jgi:glycosyltransferase involved in cell wall biosynthesis
VIFAWLNKRPWKNPGPIVNMAVHNAHALASLGHETHLFVSAADDASDVDADLREFYGLEPVETLRVHRLARWSVGGSKLALTVFLQTYRAIKQLAARDEVAVVIRDATFLPLLARLCRGRRIKGFFEAHDFYADLSWRTNQVKIGDRRQGWLERKFLPRIDGLICLTEAQRDLYAKLLPQVKSCALSLGTKSFAEVDPEERRRWRTLIYVGRLTSEKGTKVLLKAVPELAQRNIRVALLGGWEPQIEMMRGRLQQRGLAEFVDFEPFRSPRDFQRTLQTRGSIGAVLLQDNFYNRYLTCPVKALDYLSHGLPMLGSDLPSVREVAGSATIYLDPNDPAALAQQAAALLDDAEAYCAATERSRARGRELLWRNRAVAIARFAATSR